MNRRLALIALVAVTAFGLTACSGSSSTPNETAATSSSASVSTSATPSATATTGAQTVADACVETSVALASASKELAAASVAISQSGTTDAKTTIDAFTVAVDALGTAANSANNAKIKDALTKVYTSYGNLRDLLSKILVDKDLTVAADFSTAAAAVQTSITDLQTLCKG